MCVDTAAAMVHFFVNGDLVSSGHVDSSTTLHGCIAFVGSSGDQAIRFDKVREVPVVVELV